MKKMYKSLFPRIRHHQTYSLGISLAESMALARHKVIGSHRTYIRGSTNSEVQRLERVFKDQKKGDIFLI